MLTHQSRKNCHSILIVFVTMRMSGSSWPDASRPAVGNRPALLPCLASRARPGKNQIPAKYFCFCCYCCCWCVSTNHWPSLHPRAVWLRLRLRCPFHCSADLFFCVPSLFLPFWLLAPNFSMFFISNFLCFALLLVSCFLFFG